MKNSILGIKAFQIIDLHIIELRSFIINDEYYVNVQLYKEKYIIHKYGPFQSFKELFVKKISIIGVHIKIYQMYQNLVPRSIEGYLKLYRNKYNELTKISNN